MTWYQNNTIINGRNTPTGEGEIAMPMIEVQPISRPEAITSAEITELVYAAHGVTRNYELNRRCLACQGMGAVETPATHTPACQIGRVYRAIDQIERRLR